MTGRLRRVAAMLIALTLSGCYVSTAPLIKPGDADYPVADGTTFAAFVPAGDSWIPKAARTLHRKGAFYVYTDTGDPKESHPFLLKDAGGEDYVVQVSVDTKSGHDEFIYQLVRYDGKTAIQYQAECPARREWVTRGLVDRIEETTTPRCLISDFGRLVTVLKEAAVHAAPEAKFVLIKAPEKDAAAP